MLRIEERRFESEGEADEREREIMRGERKMRIK